MVDVVLELGVHMRAASLSGQSAGDPAGCRSQDLAVDLIRRSVVLSIRVRRFRGYSPITVPPTAKSAGFLNPLCCAPWLTAICQQSQMDIGL